MEMEVDFISRLESSYKNLSSRFLLKDRSFGRQYAPYYANRLKLMKKKIETRAISKWGKAIKLVELCDLNEDEECFVIGTLFKQMELQPSIVKEISEDHHLVPITPKTRYSEDGDELYIEDEVQRVPLKSGDNLKVHDHVTGVVVAVKGREGGRGIFIVSDVCYASFPDQIERPLISEDKYVALVSGLNLARSGDVLLSFQLLVDFIRGDFGGDLDHSLASKITRLVIAGSSVSHSKDTVTQNIKYLSKKTKSGCVEGVQVLDDMLQQLTVSIPVDVMPGDHDPASCLLPQQPLHPCIFPKAFGSSGMKTVTNPYEAEIDGILFLGTSGQNINSIRQYSQLDDTLDIMHHTLEWGHLAPTAPDVLGCYPFEDRDPFILENCPNVYFIGNQDCYRTSLIKGENGQTVRLIALPHFHKTSTCILVNLRNLECLPIELNTELCSEADQLA